MCGFKTKNGVEGVMFSDGEFISIEDFKIENLTDSQLKELESMHIQNELAIRKRLHDNGNLFQRVLNKLSNIERTMMTEEKAEKIINDSFTKHLRSEETDRFLNERLKRKLNGDIVNEYLERKWMEILKSKVLTAGNIAKAITAILALIALITMLFK